MTFRYSLDDLGRYSRVRDESSRCLELRLARPIVVDVRGTRRVSVRGKVRNWLAHEDVTATPSVRSVRRNCREACG